MYWQKKSCTVRKKVLQAEKKSYWQKKILLAEKSPTGRKKITTGKKKVLLAKEKYHWHNYSMYNGKAVRGPQPKQGLKTYLDYKKKQSMKELCVGCHGRIDMAEKT